MLIRWRSWCCPAICAPSMYMSKEVQGLFWKIPQNANGFLRLLDSLAQSFTLSVFLICFSPQENFSSAPSLPPPSPKTPSLSFLPVLSLLLPTSFGKSL